MIVKSGFSFGHPILLMCDSNCKKAWGINHRPRIYANYDEETDIGDPDDHCYLADQELGEAPDNPGTYEGGEGKPRRPEDRLNKWCYRECERCKSVDNLDAPVDFELDDFSKRQYNIAPHVRE